MFATADVLDFAAHSRMAESPITSLLDQWSQPRRPNAEKWIPAPPPSPGLVPQPDIDLLDLGDVLRSLAASDPEKAHIVEPRYLAELSIREVPQIMGTSSATVKRQWAVTKAWLYRTMCGGTG
jgi:hypothetical protein